MNPKSFFYATRSIVSGVVTEVYNNIRDELSGDAQKARSFSYGFSLRADLQKKLMNTDNLDKRAAAWKEFQRLVDQSPVLGYNADEVYKGTLMAEKSNARRTDAF